MAESLNAQQVAGLLFKPDGGFSPYTDLKALQGWIQETPADERFAVLATICTPPNMGIREPRHSANCADRVQGHSNTVMHYVVVALKGAMRQADRDIRKIKKLPNDYFKTIDYDGTRKDLINERKVAGAAILGDLLNGMAPGQINALFAAPNGRGDTPRDLLEAGANYSILAELADKSKRTIAKLTGGRAAPQLRCEA